MSPARPTDRWASTVLILAAIYNLAWGTWVIVRPYDLFDWTGTPRPLYAGIWQCVGMIVGVYGIGYGLAARNPYRHWPIVVVGLLGKIFGPLGFLSTQLFPPDDASVGQLPLAWGWTLITNDLIWWIPFAMILYAAARHNTAPSGEDGMLSVEQANNQYKTNSGVSLAELSMRSPVLLIFLRHAGCTFCREALDDLAQHRSELKERGVQPVLVHMGDNDKSADFFESFHVGDVPRISDPSCSLYRAYDLQRAGWYQLLAPQVWWRGFKVAILGRQGVGKLVGDGFQMPGVFLLNEGTVVRSMRHKTAADKPDLCALATQ